MTVKNTGSISDAHPNAKDVEVRLQVRYGSLALRSVSLTGIGTAELPERRELHSRAVFETVVSREA